MHHCARYTACHPNGLAATTLGDYRETGHPSHQRAAWELVCQGPEVWIELFLPGLSGLNKPFPPSLAVQNSPKGCHRDKRTQIVYSDDVYKENLVDGF